MRSGCELSPVAIKLFTAMDEYIAQSSKKTYRFTKVEQCELERMLKVLDKQIDILVEYELKRNK